MSNRKLGREGFTLLEVAISLFLVATALLAVFRLQAQNLDFQSEAYFITMAGHLVQDRIASIQSAQSLSEGSDSGVCSEDFPDFFYRSEIRKVGYDGGLYHLKVTVFTDENRPERNLSVETFLYRP